MSWLDRFRKAPAKPPEPFRHDVLGTLTWSSELDGWSGVYAGIAFTLDHEATSMPPDDLLQYASRILANRTWLDFQLSRAKATASPHLARFALEISGLQYERLYFSYTPEKKHFILAELGPGREDRCWRIMFVDGELDPLGFDD